MAVVTKSSGTQTATLDTEHTLLATTDPGIYVLSVDLNALAINSGVGEIVQLRAKMKVLSGGTVRQLDLGTYVAGTIDSPLVQSVAVVAPFGVTFTLLQPTTSSATGRAFPWSVDQTDSPVVRAATAQAGGSATITLDSSASATDDLYNGLLTLIVGGTGSGQCRYIADYVGSTKVATVTGSWTTNPSSDSIFIIIGA